jgi:hypothetical protein
MHALWPLVPEKILDFSVSAKGFLVSMPRQWFACARLLKAQMTAYSLPFLQPFKTSSLRTKPREALWNLPMLADSGGPTAMSYKVSPPT